jgi:hypothetical protein
MPQTSDPMRRSVWPTTQSAYIGSATLTAHGLGRKLELGARLHGADVAVIRAALEAISDLGQLVYPTLSPDNSGGM